MSSNAAVKTTWAADHAHSEIHFKVKHMMIATVTGEFTNYTLNVETNGDDFTSATITAEILTTSVATGAEARDQHIRSADFFNCEMYPKMIFKSTRIEKKGSGDQFTLHGDLTIKNMTKPIQLEVESGGLGKDPWGNTRAGFTLSGKVNRKDWELNWNTPLETGGLLVSDEVRIAAEIQLIWQG
jgi:polyisoprenoid-binding protein YceI